MTSKGTPMTVLLLFAVLFMLFDRLRELLK